MKIGIVTFHRAHNCGAALQCVALITVLQRMGHDVRVIDCNNIGQSFFPNVLRIRIWLGWLHFMLVSFARRERLWFRYWLFRKRHMPMTHKIGKNSKFPADIDRVVLGSDQVLNPAWMGQYGDVFLLVDKCPDRNKVSYAASFGVPTLPVECRTQFKNALSKFHALGIREDSGVEICNKELNLPIKARITIDPTLLLRADDYLKFEKPVKIDSPYVLVYWMGHTKEYLCKLAHEISAIYGIRVIVASIMAYQDSKEWMSVSPSEFLSLFRNATYVVTASFHGTAFSIINHKPFLTVIPKDLSIGGRMVSLLTKLNLLDQIVHEGCSIGAAMIRQKLSLKFDESDELLDSLRRESIEFLREALA